MSVLVDAHVHVHPGVAVDAVCSAAASGFAATRRRLGLGAGQDVLCLTESAGRDVFGELLAAGEAGGWRIASAAERSLRLERGDDRLVVVAGRQVAAHEGLEVLALGCRRELPDGRPIRDSLAAARAEDALAVVPWGFGKWWLGRGRLLRELIDDADPAWFCLGDNGGRPWFLPPPQPFACAAARGIAVLPGTDPLPFPGQERRVGSYGFVLAGELDAADPVASLRAALAVQQPRPYGRGAGPWAFVRDQVGMQLRKRRGGPP